MTAQAFVVVRLPDGQRVRLGPGDIIGRMWTAALQLHDPRVSEAHALVSLRGGDLRLLPLRGVFAVGGQVPRELTLAPGQQIAFADGLVLEIEEVELPEAVLALVGPGLAPQAAPALCSVYGGPRARLVVGYEPAAHAWVWSTGADWWLEVGAEAARPLHVGDAFDVDGARFEAVALRLGDAGGEPTRRAPPSRPVHIAAWYDTVELTVEGEPPVRLGGIGARLLSELVSIGGPAPWEAVAAELWPTETDRGQLRRKWDVTLVRLRARLRQGGIRDDLISADGSGSFGLRRIEGDTVDDRS